MDFSRPKIIVSKCLEFDACRYDGQIINNKYIKKLKKYIDFKPICPEVEIGMGTPRDTIRIIENKEERLLFQPETGKDFSKKMNAFSVKYLKNIIDIDGFIVKADSPSCGLKSAKIYPKKNNCPAKKRDNGFFTGHILSMFPNYPIEEEKRLNNVFIREHFYTSIFTIADFRTVDNIDSLYKYHAKHKYLFMAYNQTLMRKMGNVAANKNQKNIDCIKKDYYDLLLLLLSKRARYPSNINTQMHVMGYFKKLLTSKEKKHFLDTIELYRNKKTPVSTVNSILVSWINRFDNNYLKNQSFFHPFPIDLLNNEESRFL
ncbi:MAG: cytoplasmic protein [Candidatus Marinimicrobia bacterium]|nr:cytoplasmic protein [Candidatus Neomarinimicrobiota bacterium]|tara:strand:- start:36989 stop:37936 length:948 start_codon:yes stop_codon:yes gene_type:complete